MARLLQHKIEQSNPILNILIRKSGKYAQWELFVKRIGNVQLAELVVDLRTEMRLDQVFDDQCRKAQRIQVNDKKEVFLFQKLGTKAEQIVQIFLQKPFLTFGPASICRRIEDE